MKEIMPTNLDASLEDNKHPDYDLIAEKLLISRGTTTEQLGSPNVFRAAENLYAALYEPEKIDSLIASNPKFPNRMTILKKPLTNSSLKIPNKEEFIKKIRHAMTNETEFGECLSESAKEQFEKILAASEHTVIWTDGDSLGVPEHNLPGSREQLKKLAVAQFYNKVRKEEAQKRGVHHSEIFSIIAIEGKMQFIPEVVNKFAEKGIERIVIVEDRVKNLIKAMELIKKTSPEMEIFPVWIRVGQYKNKIEEGHSLEEWEKELHAIKNISEIEKVLEENNVFSEEAKVGSIFDLDGPLHDDDVRKKIQTEAVINSLKKESWI